MSGETEPALDPHDVERFRADGAVVLRAAFGPEWIEALRDGVERVLADPSPLVRINTPEGAPGRFFVDFCMWRRFEVFRRFALDSPGGEIAARMMGSRTARWYHDHLLVKEPGTLECTPWHHDQPYWPIDGEQVVSIWLPLDPVARETCPEWVAGSHRWGAWYAPRYFKDDAGLQGEGAFDPLPDVDAERDRHRLLAWDLEPGDCVVFHARALHGAPGNVTRNRRRAHASRWTGDDARWAARPGRVSPPIEGHGLAPGDPLSGELFPLVWPRAKGAGPS